jgi:hypothetical protein
MLCAVLKNSETGRIGRPFALFLVMMRFAKYMIRLQEISLELTVFEFRSVAYSLAQKHGSLIGSILGKNALDFIHRPVF